MGILNWLGSDHGEEEDDITIQAHRLVLDTLADADENTIVEYDTGENLRDQMTVEKANDIYMDMARRTWGEQRN